MVRLILKRNNLRLRDVEGLYQSLLKRGISIRNVRYVHFVLHCSLGDAVRYGMIGQNPAHGAKQPRLPQTEIRILDQDEVTQFLICVMGNRNEALYHLAVKTGMRIGELFELMGFDLEWNSGYLRILRQAQRVPSEGIKFVDPKTRAGKRTIPLGRTMLQILSEHKRKQQLEKAVAGDKWKENNLVFPSSIGTPQSESNFLKIFKALLQKAGLPIIRFHNLRQTAASIMLNNGRNFIEVSKMLGHS